jgi:hypothetical protein
MNFDESPDDVARQELWSAEEQDRAEDRRREYTQEALDLPDAQDALTQVITARLMKINAFAFASFEKGTQELGTSADSFLALKPLIDATMKSASVIERYSSFKLRRENEARRKQSEFQRPRNSR